MMVGSEIEHAMLLCNFFTTIGKKAFLVLGQGVPEGDTAYVLTVEESGEQDRLWNPMTAESFSISETFCPLESVYAIANENNIWGNIQLSDKPNRIRWDFAQGNDWMPLFSGNITNPGLPSVQPNELMVTAPDQRSSSSRVFTIPEITKLRIYDFFYEIFFVLFFYKIEVFLLRSKMPI